MNRISIIILVAISGMMHAAEEDSYSSHSERSTPIGRPWTDEDTLAVFEAKGAQDRRIFGVFLSSESSSKSSSSISKDSSFRVVDDAGNEQDVVVRVLSQSNIVVPQSDDSSFVEDPENLFSPRSWRRSPGRFSFTSVSSAASSSGLLGSPREVFPRCMHGDVLDVSDSSDDSSGFAEQPVIFDSNRNFMITACPPTLAAQSGDIPGHVEYGLSRNSNISQLQAVCTPVLNVSTIPVGDMTEVDVQTFSSAESVSQVNPLVPMAVVLVVPSQQQDQVIEKQYWLQKLYDFFCCKCC